MINLQYEMGVINTQTSGEYYNQIIDRRKYIKKVDILCKRYFKKQFRDIVIFSPDELMDFVAAFDKRTKTQKERILKKFKRIETNKGKYSNYIVDVLYMTMPDSARKTIYDVAGTKTCPYCNRNYIDIFKGDDKFKSTLDLDHFFDKDDYPMLAVCLYNLIPACPSCNRIKGTKKLQYYPYDKKKKFSSDMRFSYNILNAQLKEVDDIAIKLLYSDKTSENEAQKLYLSVLYDNHKDVALEIIKKARYQGMGYMFSLTTQFEKLFPTDDEVYKAVYGNYLNEEDWNKRPLSKFTYDIAKEVLDVYGIELKREKGNNDS